MESQTFPKEIESIIEKSNYQEDLNKLINYTFSLIEKSGLHPTTIQEKVLINHLSEMVVRAKTGKLLEEIDPSIFNKVSSNSMKIAKNIVSYVTKNIGKLAKSEKYVLSIHFETMKLNKEEEKC